MYRGPKKWNLLPEALHHTQSKNTYKLLVDNLVAERSRKACAVLHNTAM